MRKIHKKATSMFLVMLMVLGGITGLLTPGGSKAYAVVGPSINDGNISSVVTSADHKTVTLIMDVYMAPRSDVSVTEAVYVTRTGSEEFVSVVADSAANIVTVAHDEENTQTVFTFTFATPLTGNTIGIQIQGQYFESEDGDQYYGGATILDLQPPTFVRSTSNNGNYV